MSELTTTYEWKSIPWRKLERKVFKLQKQIYRAAVHGQRAKVRRLQRLLIRSWAARVLAVRRVTQDNAGKEDSKHPLPQDASTAATVVPCPTSSVWLGQSFSHASGLDSQTG